MSNGQVRGDTYSTGCLGQTGMGILRTFIQNIILKCKYIHKKKYQNSSIIHVQYIARLIHTTNTRKIRAN